MLDVGGGNQRRVYLDGYFSFQDDIELSAGRAFCKDELILKKDPRKQMFENVLKKTISQLAAKYGDELLLEVWDNVKRFGGVEPIYWRADGTGK